MPALLTRSTMHTLTEAAAAHWMKHKDEGAFCPFCGSDQVEACSSMDYDNEGGDLEVFCHNCEGEYTERYYVSSVWALHPVTRKRLP